MRKYKKIVFFAIVLLFDIVSDKRKYNFEMYKFVVYVIKEYGKSYCFFMC